MNVLTYFSRDIPDADRQHLQSLYALMAGQVGCTQFASKADLDRSKYALMHLVGCWDARTIWLQKQAEERNIPVLLSLWGTLTPWYIRRLNPACRLLLGKRVRRMVCRSTAVHVCGELEQSLFRARRWNDACERIDNPLLSNAVDERAVAAQWERLYHKVLDTRPASMLSEADERLIGDLLLAGVDPEWFSDLELQPQLESQFDQTPWRYVLMYAQQEQVLEGLYAGLKQLSLPAPHVDWAAFESFRTGDEPLNHLSTEPPTHVSGMLNKKVRRLAACSDETVRKLCYMVFHLYQEEKDHQLPLAHLVDLYCKLRLEPFDEALFVSQLRGAGLLPFFRRIEYVLQHFLRLTEGFMPAPALADKRAQQLRRKIIKI